MKKRILSLFLALAMVATAGVAVPGIQAEAAGELGTGFVSPGGVNGVTMSIQVKTANGGERDESVIRVGDKLSIVDFGKKAGEKYAVNLMEADGVKVAADSENVNIQWVNASAGDAYEAIDGATESTYTVTAADINKNIGVVLWVPGQSTTYIEGNIDKSGTRIRNFDDLREEVLKGLNKNSGNGFKATSGDAVNVGGTSNWAKKATADYSSVGIAGHFMGTFDAPSTGKQAEYAVFATTKVLVEKAKVQTIVAEDGILTLSSAEAANGTELLQIGNTLVIGKSQIFPDNKSGTAASDRLKITFGLKEGVSNKDAWGKKYDDEANGAGSDPVNWMLVEQDDKDLHTSVRPSASSILKTGDGDFSLMNNDGKVVSFGALTTNAVKTGVPYDIWAAAKEVGDKYDMNKSAVQSQYSVVFVDDMAGVLVALDLNGGDLPKAVSERYNFAQYNVTNSVSKSTDKIGVRSVTATINLAESEQKMFDLPTLPKKGDEFFQGWSDQGANGTTLGQTSNLVARYNKIYTAIWGDTEVKNTTVVGGKALYRLYNPNNGEHLYTPNASEVAGLVPLGWIEESTTFNGLAEGGTLVNRLYNPNSGEHHYVLEGSNEEKVLLGAGWLSDGGVFRSGTLSGTTPVYLYSLWNGQAGPGSHHLTNDVVEYNTLATQGWKQEGVKFSGVK